MSISTQISPSVSMKRRSALPVLLLFTLVTLLGLSSFAQTQRRVAVLPVDASKELTDVNVTALSNELKRLVDGFAIDGTHVTHIGPEWNAEKNCDKTCVLSASSKAVTQYAIQVRISRLGDGYDMTIFLFDVRAGELSYTQSDAIMDTSGLIRALKSQASGAREALRLAILSDRTERTGGAMLVPSFTKPSTRTSPTTETVTSTLLRFESNPSGARVYVNGVSLSSRTPTQASYLMGTRLKIRMEHPTRSESASRSVVVQSNPQTIRMAFKNTGSEQTVVSTRPSTKITPLNTSEWRTDISFQNLTRTSRILREFNCSQDEFAVPFANPCPNAGPEGVILNVKELDEEFQETLWLAGLQSPYFRGFSASIQVPVIMSSQRTLRFAGNRGNRNAVTITPENSTVAPSLGAALFAVPVEAPERSGLGDLQLGVEYAVAVPGTRPSEESSLGLTFDFTLPTSEAMTPGGQEVGRDIFETRVGVAAHKKVPASGSLPGYSADFSTYYVFVHVADGSIFKDYRGGQDHIGPGNRYGADFYSALDFAVSSSNIIQLGAGVSASLQQAGRDYSTLFDALGTANTPCLGPGPGTDLRGLANQACFNPDSSSSYAGLPHDGLTVVDQFLRYGASLGVDVSQDERFSIGIRGRWEWESEHLITGASPGKDLDQSGIVEYRGQPGYNPAEHNPVYSEAIDASGRRFKTVYVDTFAWTVLLKVFL